jgi:hypothetical protein
VFILFVEEAVKKGLFWHLEENIIKPLNPKWSELHYIKC